MSHARRDILSTLLARGDRLALAVQRFPPAAEALRWARRILGRPFHWFPRLRPTRREVRQLRGIRPPPRRSSAGPTVLIASVRAWGTHAAIEATIAHALTLRGARCEFFSCGGGPLICEMGWPARERGRPCGWCSHYVDQVLGTTSYPHWRLGSVLDAGERESLLAAWRRTLHEQPDPFVVNGLRIIDCVEQSMLWHTRSGSLSDQPALAVLTEDFLLSGALFAVAAQRILDQVRPDAVFLLNGLFYEERIVRELAMARDMRVVTYEQGAQSGTLFFSTAGEKPAPRYDIGNLLNARGGRLLDSREDRELQRALQARRSGGGRPRRYYARTHAHRWSGERDRVVLFTNVSWDTAVTGRSVAFPDMFAWIAAAVHLASRHPEVELVIRVHPAEARWPGMETRERVDDRIGQQFRLLPPNVRLIPPEEAVDSYALIDTATGVLVFSSTVGMEAAAAGKAVAVSGATHYRGRGFTVDVQDPRHFAELFEDRSWMVEDLARTRRARLYSFLFLCRSLVPFPFVHDNSGQPALRYEAVEELAPGADPDLDAICAGILSGVPIRRAT